MTKNGLSSRYITIFWVVLLYWFVSITLVFVNKDLLSGQIGLDAPLFITLFQCIVTIILCYVCLAASLLFPEIFKFSELPLTLEALIDVLPLSIVFVAMICFNNLCLKNVAISFYYIGRSLTTVFNVIFTYTILREKTSFQAMTCCALIIFGYWLGVDQEGAHGYISTSGVIYGVLASACVSLYSIMMKKILPRVQNNVWLLTLYNNVNACVIFPPLIFLNGEIYEIFNFNDLNSVHFWLLMIMGGVFGFAIGYVTGLQIKVTSPLTHNISGTAKAAAQTILATQYYQENKTLMWWFSNSIVLFSSALYARVRQQEMTRVYETPVEQKETESSEIES